MKDESPFVALAEAIQQMIEVQEKTVHLLPVWQGDVAAEACNRARTARARLIARIDEERG